MQGLFKKSIAVRDLLFDIDLGTLGLTMLCPVLMAGQVALIWALGRLFRRPGEREA